MPLCAILVRVVRLRAARALPALDLVTHDREAAYRVEHPYLPHVPAKLRLPEDGLQDSPCGRGCHHLVGDTLRPEFWPGKARPFPPHLHLHHFATIQSASFSVSTLALAQRDSTHGVILA